MILTDEEKNIEKEYEYITKEKDYVKLKDLPRHGNTTTYEHSIRVACLTGKIAEKMNADVTSAIKVGLLHDLCFVNYYEKNDHPGLYMFYHPVEAVENSKKYNLSKKEERAIMSHMFPGGRIPTSKIGWALTIADKIVAVKEKLYGIRKVKEKAVFANLL